MQVMFGWQETQEKIKKENSAISQTEENPSSHLLHFQEPKSKETNVNKLTNREKKSTETKYSIREQKEKKKERTFSV